jgi:hypothetical protein
MERAIIGDLLTCVNTLCGHSFDKNSVEMELGTYGRECRCPKCNTKMVILKRAAPSGKKHMSKHERRKMREKTL